MTRAQFASFLCVAIAACLVQASLTHAGPMGSVNGDVIVTVTGSNPLTPVEPRKAEFRIPVRGDDSFVLTDAKSQGTEWSLTDLDVTGNVDPFTSLNYAVTNNAAVPLLFTVSVTLPIVPEGPLTLHGGSMGATLTDSNFNGSASVSTFAGVPLYRGQIDGVTVLSIYPDPYSLSVAFAGQTVNVPALSPGLPGPTLPSGPATATISIINQFLLSPGDMFSGNSFFVIVGVPEPSTLALLALSVLTLAGRRR
jgi:hypothetical protein